MLLRSHWGSSLSPDQPTTHFAAGKTQTALVVVMEPSVAWMIACVNMLMYKIISFLFCCRKLLFAKQVIVAPSAIGGESRSMMRIVDVNLGNPGNLYY